ncbi:MAG: hypothetical protein RIR11_1239 [Bacteroidota bacterium]|jgi:hypothetical protein
MYAPARFALIALLFAQCARPCPKDIEIGVISIGSTTKTFLPAAQETKTMTFKNSDGTQLVFQSTFFKGDHTYDLPVETLCERGDFLDKTSQTVFFVVKSKRWEYETADKNYTLSLDLNLNPIGEYGDRKDTVFYEQVAVWGQKINNPTRVGRISILSDERGNAAKITDLQRQNANFYQIIADTTLNGRQIKNAYVPVNDGTQSLFIFYTKAKGIEAFTTDTEVWTRE